jgi:undecaprenyl diphosphate synthase
MTHSQQPRHIAIVMDGNGRWAKQRSLPRVAGHKVGLEAVRRIISTCGEKNIEALTLFAFGTDNWRRPESEVGYLMELFFTALKAEIKKLHKQQVRLHFIGDRSRLNKKLLDIITKSEQTTATNSGLKLTIAVSYSGQWDIYQAMQKIAAQVEQGQLRSDAVSPDIIEANLTLAGLPYPDLFIRTSGEQRISNFFLWQLAYTELYFTDVLWPDFDAAELEKALTFYANRERRFGHISEQLSSATS